MRSLSLILVFAALLISVPSFMALAQDTTSEKTDDIFVDENSPMDEETYPPVSDDEAFAGEGIAKPHAPEKPAAEQPLEKQIPHESAKVEEKAAPAKVEAKAEKTEAKVAKAEEKAVKKVEKKEAKRKTASAGGFKTTKADCPMHADAADGSAVLTTVKGSKKIWTEKHADGWVKTFRTSGHGFMSESCFE
jgi:hypothetical protein